VITAVHQLIWLALVTFITVKIHLMKVKKAYIMYSRCYIYVYTEVL